MSEEARPAPPEGTVWEEGGWVCICPPPPPATRSVFGPPPRPKDELVAMQWDGESAWEEHDLGHRDGAEAAVNCFRAWAIRERARADKLRLIANAERALRKAQTESLGLLMTPEADLKSCADAARVVKLAVEALRALGVEP